MTGADDLSPATIHELLSHRRRRIVLARLIDPTPPFAAADLAEDVAVREREVASAEIPDATIRSIYLTLAHNHLPKLAEAGVVEYDQDRMVIRRGRNIDQVKRFLSRAPEEEERER